MSVFFARNAHLDLLLVIHSFVCSFIQQALLADFPVLGTKEAVEVAIVEDVIQASV